MCIVKCGLSSNLHESKHLPATTITHGYISQMLQISLSTQSTSISIPSMFTNTPEDILFFIFRVYNKLAYVLTLIFTWNSFISLILTKRRNFIEHTSNVLFTEERETLWLAACAAVLFQTRIHLLLVVIALYIWLPFLVYANLKVNMLVILAYCFFCVFRRERRRVTAIIRVSRLPMVLICCFWYKSSSNGKLAKQQTSFLDYIFQFEQKYNTNYSIMEYIA